MDTESLKSLSPFSFAEVRQIVEAELGRPIDRLPIGDASDKRSDL
jgi:hypothetical protein